LKGVGGFLQTKPRLELAICRHLSMSYAQAPQSTTNTTIDIEQVITDILEKYRDNRWFIDTYWPENEARTRLILNDILVRFTPSRQAHVFDIGCFNGYFSLILDRLGYRVTATDSCELEDRTNLFKKTDIEFLYSNLNELSPFRHIAPGSFDVVVMGEVIEHVVNHPLGLMRSVAEIVRPGGLLILTTPNPSTVMNAARVLLDKSSLWGTSEFIEEPKFKDGKLISYGGIHYREYRTEEVLHLLGISGFSIERVSYIGMGIGVGQSPIKRLIKQNFLIKRLMSMRPFACTHYFLTRRGE
jgi:2-polyprenyl-3-methyl-5-hydroxy-6-metoxy-1,4-benzoquinol methylase